MLTFYFAGRGVFNIQNNPLVTAWLAQFYQWTFNDRLYWSLTVPAVVLVYGLHYELTLPAIKCFVFSQRATDAIVLTANPDKALLSDSPIKVNK